MQIEPVSPDTIGKEDFTPTEIENLFVNAGSREAVILMPDGISAFKITIPN